MGAGEQILIGGGSDGPCAFDPGMGNRHGLIAGATGTGKTMTLQVLAEGVARAIGSQIGRQIIRGVLGSILRGR